MIRLFQKLDELAVISSELEVNSEQQQMLIIDTSSFTTKFIESLSEAKAFIINNSKSNLLTIDGRPKSLQNILEIYTSEVVEKGVKAASGGHMGYIPGGGLYTAAIGDYIAAVTNEYAGVHYASPGAVTIENEIINWLKQILNFPEDSAGNLTSGGSIANLIAIVAARDKYKVKNEAVQKHVVYLSSQTHHSIYKGLKIAGLEDVLIRVLKTNHKGQIDIEELQNSISNDKSSNLIPFLIVASAGTTDTGTIDPLFEIGLIANTENIWYHIDAAYGGFFILVEEKKHLFRGISLADSINIDPHKGLFIPYGLGAVLIKDKRIALKSFNSNANYMQDAIHENIDAISPADISPELSKHFRGLRLWLPLQYHGIEPFKACLEEKLILTKIIRLNLVQRGFCVGPEPELTVTYFWYSYNNVNDDEFNKKLLENILQDGSIFLSSTLINDKFVIRIAILSFRTKLKTVQKCLEMIDLSLIKTKKFFD